jgi:hypothetical protein
MIKYSPEKIRKIAKKLTPEALVTYRDNVLAALLLKHSEIGALNVELHIIDSLIHTDFTDGDC